MCVCVFPYTCCVFQEARGGLHVCKGEGACMPACPGVICELCRHVGHVHEWVREMGLCEGGGWMGYGVPPLRF